MCIRKGAACFISEIKTSVQARWLSDCLPADMAVGSLAQWLSAQAGLLFTVALLISKELSWKGFIQTFKKKKTCLPLSMERWLILRFSALLHSSNNTYRAPVTWQTSDIVCTLSTSLYRIKISRLLVLCILVKSALGAQLSLCTRWVNDGLLKAWSLLQSGNKPGVVRFRCWCLSFLSDFLWGRWWWREQARASQRDAYHHSHAEE